MDYPAWSADSQFLFVNSFVLDQPAIFRIHVPDGKVQKIADLPLPNEGRLRKLERPRARWLATFIPQPRADGRLRAFLALTKIFQRSRGAILTVL